MACIRYVLLEKRSIVETYNIDISNIGAPSVKFNFAEDHPLTLAFGKERKFRGPEDFFAAITT